MKKRKPNHNECVHTSNETWMLNRAKAHHHMTTDYSRCWSKQLFHSAKTKSKSHYFFEYYTGGWVLV